MNGIYTTSVAYWQKPPPRGLRKLWEAVAPLRRAPHVVLEVHRYRYVPDGVAIDYTAMEKAVRGGPYGAILPAKLSPANEQRYIISEGTLAKLRLEHPDWFGPFGVRVECKDCNGCGKCGAGCVSECTCSE